jgi:hypothetical protein
MTALLSTPNSLASSYTRTFATALPLLGPACRTYLPTGAARAPSGVSLCCSSPHAHRALITMSAFFLPAPTSCQHRTSAQPRRLPRYSATRPTGSTAVRRRDRASALRRWARSKHARLGCRYAPLPGSRPVISGTISVPATTRRINSGLAARAPQPTHVRIGGTGRADCSRRCGCAVLVRAVLVRAVLVRAVIVRAILVGPVPLWAGVVRLALVSFSLPCRPSVPPPPQLWLRRLHGWCCFVPPWARRLAYQAASGAPDPATLSPSGATSSGAADAAAGPELAVSGLMSIRQPVSLAASRAFCPSLPMASDS